MFSGIISIVANALFCYLFFNYTNLEAAGMALAYSIAGTINAFILLYILNRKSEGIDLKSLLIFTVKILFASLVMGALLIYVKRFVYIDFVKAFSLKGKIEELFYLMLIIATGVAIYFCTVLLMGIEEARYFFTLVKSKIIKG